MVSTTTALGATLGLGVIDREAVIMAAIVAAIGIVLLAVGWFGLVPTGSTRDQVEKLSDTGIRIVSTVIMGTVFFLITGWIVVTIYAAVAGWFGLTLKNAKRERAAAIDRVDAIATWVENIRDNISGSAGLQQALRMSEEHAPPAIRPAVRDLVLRMQHEPVTLALRRFAADVAHPSSDMVVACLLLANSRSAGGLADVLARTAQAARDSASMMRQVDAGRAAVQAQAKLVGLVTGGVSLLMVVARRDFVAPYDSFGGQVALFVVCGVYAISATILYRSSRPVPQLRVFAGVSAPEDTSDAGTDAADDSQAELTAVTP